VLPHAAQDLGLTSLERRRNPRRWALFQRGLRTTQTFRTTKRGKTHETGGWTSEGGTTVDIPKATFPQLKSIIEDTQEAAARFHTNNNGAPEQ
jgi:hypothetical protein